MFRRANDLLAIALFAVLLLTIGRQFSIWWREAETAPAATTATATYNSPTSAWPADTLPVALQVDGFTGTLTRTNLRGTPEQARQQAARLAFHQVETSPFANSARTLLEPELPRSLTANDFIAASPSGLEAYLTSGPSSLLVIVEPSEKNELRTLCLGYLFHGNPESWTLYLMGPQPNEQHQRSEKPAIAQLPPPPNGRILLSFRKPDGTAMTHITGPSSIQEAMRYYQTWFEERKADCTKPWHSSGSTWSASYVLSAPENVRIESNNTHAHRVDLLLRSDEQGISGMLHTFAFTRQETHQTDTTPE